MNKDLIINFTPTGMIPDKELTSHVPVSVQEIVQEAHEAIELGISMIHIHARDEKDGRPTYRKDIYAEIIQGIRQHSEDVIICVSLSGRNFNEFSKRSEVLDLKNDLKPDMGSLTLSSLNFQHTASINAPDMVRQLARKMQENKILPELEVFDLGMINYAKYLIKKGDLYGPHYFNLLLGNIAGAQADPLQAGLMIRELPDNSYWSMAGIGSDQLKMNALSIACGGGVRVGLEDNIWFDQLKTQKASNIQLLKRIHQLAEIHQRSILSAKKLRELLHLEKGFGKYGRKVP